MFSSICDSEYRYTLIFMDCSMPIKDGYTTTEEIRQICIDKNVEQPYIVAVTGHSE